MSLCAIRTGWQTVTDFCSMHYILSCRMTDDRDELARYLYYYSTGTVDDPLDGCDNNCQIQYLCKFGSGSFDIYLDCLRHGFAIVLLFMFHVQKTVVQLCLDTLKR